MNKILFLFALMGIVAVATSPSMMSSQTAFAQKIPDHYIVVLEDNVDPSQFLQSFGAKNNLHVKHVYENALNGFSAVIPYGQLKKLSESDGVKSIEQDAIVKIHAKPETPPGKDKPKNDSPKNDGSDQVVPTGISRIGITTIDNIPDQTDVDIAIIDTGIDYDNQDLNVINGYNAITDQTCMGNAACANDDEGHGTHVAGTAAAEDNDIDVVGVAPGARLWSIKVLDATGSGTYSDVIAGLDFVYAHSSEIDVVNMSLGGPKYDPVNVAVQKVIDAGVVVSVSAGNSHDYASNYSPASVVDAITVSALIDHDGEPGHLSKKRIQGWKMDDWFAYFSNYGTIVDIMAPGYDILSTKNGGGTEKLSGTSMSSPHVAGAAALYLASNPNATPSEVRSALVSNGTFDYDSITDLSFGDLDGIQEPLLHIP